MLGSEISLSKPIKWNVGETNTFTSDEVQFIESKYSAEQGAFKDITITLPMKIGQLGPQEMTFLVTRGLNGEIHFATTDFLSKTNIYSKQIEQAINKSRGAQPSITYTKKENGSEVTYDFESANSKYKVEVVENDMCLIKLITPVLQPPQTPPVNVPSSKVELSENSTSTSEPTEITPELTRKIPDTELPITTNVHENVSGEITEASTNVAEEKETEKLILDNLGNITRVKYDSTSEIVEPEGTEKQTVFDTIDSNTKEKEALILLERKITERASEVAIKVVGGGLSLFDEKQKQEKTEKAAEENKELVEQTARDLVSKSLVNAKQKIADGSLLEDSKKLKAEKIKLDLLRKQPTEQLAETKIELGAKVGKTTTTSEQIDEPLIGDIIDGVEVIDISSTEAIDTAINKAIAARNEEKGVLAFIKDRVVTVYNTFTSGKAEIVPLNTQQSEHSASEINLDKTSTLDRTEGTLDESETPSLDGDEIAVEAAIETPKITPKSILKQNTETAILTEEYTTALDIAGATSPDTREFSEITAAPVELLLNDVTSKAKTGADEKPALAISGSLESQRTVKQGSEKFKLKAIDSLVKLDQELDVAFDRPLIVVHLENLLVFEELHEPLWGKKQIIETSLGQQAALMFERVRRKAMFIEQSKILILSRRTVAESEELLKKYGITKNKNLENTLTSYDEIAQIKGDKPSVQGIVQAIRDKKKALEARVKETAGNGRLINQRFTCVKIVDENPEQLAMTVFELSQDHQLKPSLDESQTEELSVVAADTIKTQTKEAIPVQGIAVIGSAQSRIDVGMHKNYKWTDGEWAKFAKQVYLINNREWAKNNQFGPLDVEIEVKKT